MATKFLQSLPRLQTMHSGHEKKYNFIHKHVHTHANLWQRTMYMPPCQHLSTINPLKSAKVRTL
jgi:hypothetical protein